MAKRITRQTQLAKREEVKKQLLKHFTAITEGFNNQVERADDNLDFWDIYNCVLSGNQFYTGNSRNYVQLVHNGIEARKTRFLNQIFPQVGRYIEVTTEDGEIPSATMALLEQYVERAQLKDQIIPALLVSGDIEGQYTICVTWGSRKRNVVTRETSPVMVGGIEHPDLGEQEKLKEEEIEDAGPDVDIVADADLLILPQTAQNISAALEAGGSVTTLCRWTQTRIEELIEDEEIDSDLTAEMLTEMRLAEEGSIRDTPKKLADAAGIRAGGKFALVYRSWMKIKIDGKKRLVLAYYGGDDIILGCKLCPYWCDKPDIISAPLKKMPGVSRGQSLVKPCARMQYMANDFVNMGLDTGIFSVNPVIMTDPEKNPKISTMVLDLMAVWEVSPKDTQVLTFPALYEHCFNIISAAERYIQQTLGVNPAMIPQSTGAPGRKRNQAEIAMEQQVDILTTNVEVSGSMETGILTEMINRFAEYDAQFRDVEATVRAIGEVGVKAEMMTVPPLQMGRRWKYRWFGVEASRTAQQVQQQISWANVLRQFSQDPSIAQQGYQVNLIPLLTAINENVLGPRMGGMTFKNMRDQLAIDPELENDMLREKFDIPVSPMDDDPKHIEAHMMAMRDEPDLAIRMTFTKHLALHQGQMKMKQMQQMMQQMAQQQQGGGQRPSPGPRQGATPQPPRIGQQPAGRIAPDRLGSSPGVIQMPRRAG